MNASVKTILQSALVLVVVAVLGTAASLGQTAMDVTRLPLRFEAGHGQAGMTAPFAAHGPDSVFSVTETNAQFVLRKRSGESAAASMQFVGANASAQIAGEEEMPGKVNYLLGNDSARWRPGVPVFARVSVTSLYPGINVVYYGNGRQLEYDFDLAAGVDPKTIAIRFDGAEKISVDSQGELVVSLTGGEIVQHRPVVYQNIGLTRREISCGYKILDAHTATFALGGYDHSQPLVIDPVLSYSTYFGGNSGTIINAVALGNDGSIYVAGETVSTLFTNVQTAFTNKQNGITNVQPVFQPNFQGGSALGDAFVAKFASSGTNLYFTYLGGSGDDAALGLAVDNAGDAYITGYTDSANFPTKNPVQSQIAGSIDRANVYPVDAFVTELNTNGTALVYSTFLGGNQADVGKAIAVDTNGYAYVVGYTSSTNFPVQANAFQTNLQCRVTVYNANAFLAEINPGGGAKKYASFFGGTNLDVATAIALNPTDNSIYVAGYTFSTNFPTQYALQYPLHGVTNLNGSTADLANDDAFVLKFNTNFSSLVYSTFLGGSNTDWATGIAVDKAGDAYVVGATTSTNFPSTNFPSQLYSSVYTNIASIAAATNAFLTKIVWNANPPWTSNSYSAIFGGVGYDIAVGVGLDKAGNAYVVGSASSSNFPVTTNNLAGPLAPTNSSVAGLSDVFITAFNTNGVILYSAYLGGSGDDFGTSIAVDYSTGNAYIAGESKSVNFPTINAPQTALDGSVDGFLARILSTSFTVQLAVPSQVTLGHGFLITGTATEPGGTVTNLTLLLGTNQLILIQGNTAQTNFSSNFSWDFPGTLAFSEVATDANGVQNTANATVNISHLTLPLLTLDGITFQGSGFKLLMFGQTGTNYQVLANTNLETTNWITLGVMQNTNGIWRFFDSTATSFPDRFYRAKALP